MRNLPETVHAYNIPRLNLLFVVFSLLLLGTTGWILWDDFFREWKPYQRQAKVFKIDKLLQEQAAAQKRIEESNYKEVISKLAQTSSLVNQKQSELATLSNTLIKVSGELKIRSLELNSLKASLDERKSQFDEAVEFRKGDKVIQQRKSALRKQQEAVEAMDLKIQGIKEEKTKTDDSILAIISDQLKLSKEATRLEAERNLLDGKIKALREASPLLDAPLVEFAKPNIKIEQIIADDQTYDLNFVQVPRIDRCSTCHAFADKLDSLPEGEAGFRYAHLPQPFTSHPRLDLFLDANSPHKLERFGCSTCHLGWDRGTSFIHSAHTPAFNPIKQDYVKFPVVESSAQWRPKAMIEKWKPGVIAKVEEHAKLMEERDALKQNSKDQEKLNQVRASIATLRSELKAQYGLDQTGLSQIQFASMTQEQAWEGLPFHWHPMHHKEDAMRPREFVESSCIKCHQNVTEVPVQLKPLNKGSFEYKPDDFAPDKPLNPGEKVNAGLRLIEQSGCYACHKMAALETVVKHKVLLGETLESIAHARAADPASILLANGLQAASDVKEGRELTIPVRVPFAKPGPSLVKIALKTNREWMLKWLENPKAFRPNTFMPQFWNLDNNRAGTHFNAVQPGPDGQPVKIDWADRNAVEMKSIVEFIFAKSESSSEYKAPPAGNIENGKKLVNEVGCMGCHVEDQKLSELAFRDRRFRSQGPMLHGAGSKYNAAWLNAWLLNPAQYRHNTRMPNLRLSEKEAADITAYLLGNHNQEFEARTLPTIKPEVLRDTTLDYLRSGMPMKAALHELDEKYATDESRYQFLGAKLVERYGCMNCHDIKGYETAKPISIELSNWASKLPNKLDFGFIEIPHNNYSFLHQKLQAPRSLDRVETKRPQEMMVMPQFNFTEEQIDLIMTAVMGMTGEDGGKAKRQLSEADWALENGRWLIKELNCMGCHINEHQGGAIRRIFPKDGDDEDKVFLFPPSLQGVGTRVRADWLRAFIKNPGENKFRYWMPTRMPTYQFSDDQLNILTRYFAVRDKVPYPFEGDVLKDHVYHPTNESIELGSKIVTQACLKCHAQATPEKALQDAEAKVKSPAINLARVKDRTRHKGLYEWLSNPGNTGESHPITPGVTMPSLTPVPEILGGDKDKQIKAVMDYLLYGNVSSSASAPAPAIHPK